MRKPRVCAPPCKHAVATAGMSTVYGMPITLTSASKRSTERMGANEAT